MRLRRLLGAVLLLAAMGLYGCGQGSSPSPTAPAPPVAQLLAASKAALTHATSVTVSGTLTFPLSGSNVGSTLALQMTQSGTLGTVTINNTTAGVVVAHGKLDILAPDAFSAVSSLAQARAQSTWVSIPTAADLPSSLAPLSRLSTLPALAATLFAADGHAKVTGSGMAGGVESWIVKAGKETFYIAAGGVPNLMQVNQTGGSLSLGGYGGPVGLGTPASTIALSSVMATPTATPSPPPTPVPTPTPTPTATPTPTPSATASAHASPATSPSPT